MDSLKLYSALNWNEGNIHDFSENSLGSVRFYCHLKKVGIEAVRDVMGMFDKLKTPGRNCSLTVKVPQVRNQHQST